MIALQKSIETIEHINFKHTVLGIGWGDNFITNKPMRKFRWPWYYIGLCSSKCRNVQLYYYYTNLYFFYLRSL